MSDSRRSSPRRLMLRAPVCRFYSSSATLSCLNSFTMARRRSNTRRRRERFWLRYHLGLLQPQATSQNSPWKSRCDGYCSCAWSVLWVSAFSWAVSPVLKEWFFIASSPNQEAATQHSRHPGVLCPAAPHLACPCPFGGQTRTQHRQPLCRCFCRDGVTVVWGEQIWINRTRNGAAVRYLVGLLPHIERDVLVLPHMRNLAAHRHEAQREKVDHQDRPKHRDVEEGDEGRDERRPYRLDDRPPADGGGAEI